jgi:hypothetical protein
MADSLAVGVKYKTMSLALLHLVPALLLLTALAFRRYPGERRLIVLVQARRSPRRRSSDRAPMRSHPRARLPRGGPLLGSALAVRPPPGLLAAS